MDGQSINYTIGIVILLILSGLFSAAEMAYSSCNKIRLKKDAKTNKRILKTLEISNNFEKYLTTILVGNNIVNILTPLLVAALFGRIVGGINATILSFIVTTFVVLIFGEIIPKAYAKRNSNEVAIKLTLFLLFNHRFLKPVVFLFSTIQQGILKLFKDPDDNNVTATEEELVTLIDTMSEEAVIDDDQKDLIRSAITFNSLTVDQISQPRIDIFAIEVNNSIEAITQLLMENNFSRVPIYEKTIDNIIGVLYERDFFALLVKNQAISVREIMRKTVYLNPNMKVDMALTTLQKEKVHMAVVIDEYGGTKGIITLEDILEELVGEIYDEYDEEIKFVRKINDHEYLIHGEMSIEKLFEEILKLDYVPSTEQKTLSGWLYTKFELLPNVGAYYEELNVTFEITKIDNRRISEVRVNKNIDRRKNE